MWLKLPNVGLFLSMKLIKLHVKAITLLLHAMCQVKVYNRDCSNYLRGLLLMYHLRGEENIRNKNLFRSIQKISCLFAAVLLMALNVKLQPGLILKSSDTALQNNLTRWNVKI